MSAISTISNSAGYGGYGIYNDSGAAGESSGITRNPGESSVKSPGRKSSPAECETCKNRKYQDGSDEMVSFKSATHISPQAAASAVRSHEQEHVSHAYKKAAQTSYVSGGTTNTQIKYYNEDNPYQKDLKAADSLKYQGMNLDMAV